MSDLTAERRDKGLYWGRAWKLVEGCTKVSPGCDNCWSESETEMRGCQTNEKISDRANAVLSGKGFSGEITLRNDNLDLPLRTKKPTVWAIWNDLYHADVTEEFRDRAYAVMALCPQHTFLVLTKRAPEMAGYWSQMCDRWLLIEGEAEDMGFAPREIDAFDWLASKNFLPNVWHGVTVENQAMADERIPHLLRGPGKRFLSIEPMLSAIDLSAFFGGPYATISEPGFEPNYNFGIHQVLLGGESGKNARPMHRNWVYSVRDQCEAAGVPFFFKQWGEWVNKAETGSDFSGSKAMFARLDGQHDDPMEIVRRVGKKKAGRQLDGRTHDELPWNGSQK